MGLDTHYPNRKDKKKRYWGPAGFDHSCRPHGGCPWCFMNRMIHTLRELERTSYTEPYNGINEQRRNIDQNIHPDDAR